MYQNYNNLTTSEIELLAQLCQPSFNDLVELVLYILTKQAKVKPDRLYEVYKQVKAGTVKVAYVATHKKLSLQKQADIKTTTKEQTGYSDIIYYFYVDTKLFGGYTIKIGDLLLDYSLNRLIAQV